MRVEESELPEKFDIESKLVDSEKPELTLKDHIRVISSFFLTAPFFIIILTSFIPMNLIFYFFTGYKLELQLFYKDEDGNDVL